MKKITLFFGAIALTVVGFQNCKPNSDVSISYPKQLVLPDKPFDYKAEVASFVADLPIITAKAGSKSDLTNLNKGTNGTTFFEPSGMAFNSNEIKNEVATLGRVLFYDPQLSINNTIACGSCHLQSKAFSDLGEGSAGFKGTTTTRNSMAITNPMLTRNLFWDSRTKSLQQMVLQPVQNHVEMGMEDLAFLAQKLQKTNYYAPLFKKAFGTEGVTPDGINTALMQFLTSMVSHNSKFDKGAKTEFANFNGLEAAGKTLFMSERLGCVKCHAGANFSLGDEISQLSTGNPYGGSGTDSPEGTANIGLNLVYKDNGKGNGKFKIPTLRNIELTAPYMHDGRFKTLEQVVEHYNSGIQSHPKLDDNLKDSKGEPKRMNLTNVEKSALIAFLKTLTDNTYATDPKYSNPFQN